MEDKKKIQSFTDLEVWQEAHKLVILIYEITKKFPKEELFGLTSQMKRAAISITSNIAEGFSRFSYKEKVQFYSIARGSLTELQNQLLTAKDIIYLDSESFKQLSNQSIIVHKLLNAFIKSTKSPNSKFQIPNSFILTLLSVFYIFYPFYAGASFISVAPAIIDLKAYPRDILSGKITITNNDSAKKDIYVFVYDISSETGQEQFLDPSRADKSSSLANWLSISRGVIELLPKEQKEIDWRVDVNLSAKTGIYHSVIYFSDGTVRADAEKKLKEAPKVLMNLEAREKIIESAQLKKFFAEKNYFFKTPAKFYFQMENIGNRAVFPEGEIIIYKISGEEIASLKIEGENMAPNEIKKMGKEWYFKNRAGKFKAFLDISYGPGKRFQDTVFFWAIPFEEKHCFNSLRKNIFGAWHFSGCCSNFSYGNTKSVR